MHCIAAVSRHTGVVSIWSAQPWRWEMGDVGQIWTHLDTPLLALIASISGLLVKSTMHDLISDSVDMVGVGWESWGAGNEERGTRNDKR